MEIKEQISKWREDLLMKHEISESDICETLYYTTSILKGGTEGEKDALLTKFRQNRSRFEEMLERRKREGSYTQADYLEKVLEELKRAESKHIWCEATGSLRYFYKPVKGHTGTLPIPREYKRIRGVMLVVGLVTLVTLSYYLYQAGKEIINFMYHYETQIENVRTNK